MKEKLWPLVMVFVSMSSMAGEFSVTKTETPNAIIGSAKALSMHRLMGKDYPTPSSMTGARLAAVSWSAARYPQSTGEGAEICYQRVGNALKCDSIQPGGSGTVSLSAAYPWGYTSYIMIRHFQTGGPVVSRPVGSDSITFHMTY